MESETSYKSSDTSKMNNIKNEWKDLESMS